MPGKPVVDQKAIDVLRSSPIDPGGLYTDGCWREATEGATLDVVSPVDGAVLTSIARGTEADVDAAVQAARAAFDRGGWSQMPPSERGRILLRVADLVDRDSLELAVLGVRDNGTEIAMALAAEPGSAATTFRFYGGIADKINGEITPTPEGTLGMVFREPVGVVGVIVPWNMPLMIGAWKIAPALAAGNSVVLKPSPDASLALLRLVRLCEEAGLPPGVLNVVTGDAVTGQALSRHHGVDTIAFTGSAQVGRRLLEASAQSNLKQVHMELGGKSPNIVFDDAPSLDEAAQVSALAIFRNSGQVCVAGSRLLVQSSIVEEFTSLVVERTRKLTVGDPLQLSTDIGAVVNEGQLEQNLEFVRRAASEGGRLLSGGNRIRQETGGCYMEPTIFDRVAREATLAREEIFGPVLAIVPFDTEDQAVEIANDSRYGLASAVWTADLSRAHRMIRRIDAGVVQVNTYGGADITVPLTGRRESGNSSDRSLHALDKYLTPKTAWIRTQP